MAIALRNRHRNTETISVGFSGAAGVGKTTLVNAMNRYYKNQGFVVDVVEEVARDIFALYRQTHGVKTLDEMRLIPELYLMFQNDVLEIQITKEKRILEKSPELLLLDRTVYDNYLYTLLYCRRSDQPRMFDQITQNVYDYLSSQPYHHIIYLSPHEVKEDDAFRSIDDLESQATQDILLKMISSFSFNHIKYITTTVFEERFGYLVFLIDNWLKERAFYRMNKTGVIV